jgi:predicted TIM-barrel fold metal-dependent hydrolase
LHPPLQQFQPNDKPVYPFYEVVNEAKLPVIFHTGHSGIGTGQLGGGVLLKYGNPMNIDDVAVDFPDIPIIIATSRIRGRTKLSRCVCTSRRVY